MSAGPVSHHIKNTTNDDGSNPDAKDALKILHRRGIKGTLVVGSPASGAVLKSAGLKAADVAVVCGLSADDSGAGAGGAGSGDAQAVATVLQLQSLAARDLAAGRRAASLGVVVAVRSTAAEEVLWHATLSHEAEVAHAAVEAAWSSRRGGNGSGSGSGSGGKGAGSKSAAARLADLPAAVELRLLAPDQLLSGMVTQAAVEPRLNRVFAELFATGGGHEVYLKRAARFGLPPSGGGGGDGSGSASSETAALTWSQISEAVRLRGQTAVGLAPRVGGPDAIVLAPPAGAVFEVGPEDEVVVVAEDGR